MFNEKHTVVKFIVFIKVHCKINFLEESSILFSFICMTSCHLFSTTTRRHTASPKPETRPGLLHLRMRNVRSSFPALEWKETRWAISSSIGVTQENSARVPDPGQFSVYLVVMKSSVVAAHFWEVCCHRDQIICDGTCTTAWRRLTNQYGGGGWTPFHPQR